MKKRKGFYYVCTEDQIREYRCLSLTDKLKWLWEANQFSHKMIKGKRKRIWEDFRAGNV